MPKNYKLVNWLDSRNEIIRPRELPRYTGLSKTSIWRIEKLGQFVPKIRLSAGCVGYRKADIDAWLSARIEVQSEV